MNQSKYENYENERAIRGQNIFSITIHLPCAPPTVTVCRRCYKWSKKATKKDLAHPEDHLECSLRPIHATPVNTGPFWTRHKKLEAFQTLSKNFATWKLFSIEGAPQFTELLKRLSPANSPIRHCRLVQDSNHTEEKKSGKKTFIQRGSYSSAQLNK